MLALTRRVGEEVVIGDPSNPLGIIRVVDVHGEKVRLAFDFPRDLPINRRELADQKARGPQPEGGEPESSSQINDAASPASQREEGEKGA